MIAGVDNSLAILVASPPYRTRSARQELDVALAAAALDFRLEVYFLGSALLQLITVSAPDALLPPGYRGWGALPDLGDTRCYAEQAWLERIRQGGADVVLPVEGLDPTAMKQRWRGCRHSLVL